MNEERKMRGITVFLSLLMIVFIGCEQKEQPKAPPQPPAGQFLPQADPSVLQKIVRDDPKNVRAWIQLGNIMMDTARFNEAIDAYQKALAIDPNNVDVRVDMGTCYRNAGKPDLAVKEYRKALEINPNHANGHKNLGVVLAVDLKDNAGAANELEKYLQLVPNAPDAGAVRQEIQRLRAAK